MEIVFDHITTDAELLAMYNRGIDAESDEWKNALAALIERDVRFMFAAGVKIDIDFDVDCDGDELFINCVAISDDAGDPPIVDRSDRCSAIIVASASAAAAYAAIRAEYPNIGADEYGGFYDTFISERFGELPTIDALVDDAALRCDAEARIAELVLRPALATIAAERIASKFA